MTNDNNTSPEDKGWKHQALVDLSDKFERDHKRIRVDLSRETFDREKDIDRIELRIIELEKMIELRYVRKDVFDSIFGPVQRGFYGVIALITMTVILSLLYLVVKK